LKNKQEQMKIKSLPRREFLRRSTVAGGGLLIVANASGIGGFINPPGNSPVSEVKHYPVQLGVDISFGADFSSERACKLFELLEQWKINYVDIHIWPVTNVGSRNTILMGERIGIIDKYMRKHNIAYTLNVKAPNFALSTEITPGINEYDQPGGLHRWDLRMEWLDPVLPPSVPVTPAFQGIVYDECEHMQISNNLPAGSNPNGLKWNVTVDDVAQFLVNFKGGATGCFESTRLATGRKNYNTIEVNGEKGSVVWNFEDQNWLSYYDNEQPSQETGFKKINVTHDVHPYKGGWWPQGHGIGYADSFVIEVSEFLRSIADNKPFSPDFEDGVKCQEVLEAVEKSAVNRTWIKL
jgi:hypothetical protein